MARTIFAGPTNQSVDMITEPKYLSVNIIAERREELTNPSVVLKAERIDEPIYPTVDIRAEWID